MNILLVAIMITPCLNQTKLLKFEMCFISKRIQKKVVRTFFAHNSKLYKI